MLANKNQEAKKWQMYIIGLIIILTIFLKLYYTFYLPKLTIKVNDKTFNVLMANNMKTWEKGLGGRKNLGKYDGMLFVFPEIKQHVFIMRGMQFPIDIIWFKNGLIVDIAPNISPEPGKADEEFTLYPARDASDRVLELSAGSVEKFNLKIGDKLEILR
ncbi:MAG: hypothetical protein ACD_72C00108G0006 [uncultured bacterium]|uniref:DUF192 domain-containing protein n=1 Tax=Candidatus Magasanikbacteria bacterium RIFOXYD2_FULL_36_9 TaxID=1798707 RepID=A0A1F6P1B6_9BACT|nr:MAG: hypothetical protein ACD_72C00108G0006 [uncultured bacterium]OGH89962.1 MAG: hypothetical protein A2537_01700 [Candidatus Magasanikbacteria bacterium RIFOXYD2_FULL_36_9]